MSESKKRKSYSAEFKAKVALEAVRGVICWLEQFASAHSGRSRRISVSEAH